MVEFGKVLGLLLLSATKFFLAPSSIVLAGYSFGTTISISSFGGILGFLAFFYGGHFIRRFVRNLFKSKRTFKINKKNRRIVRLKNKYGLVGIAILTPCLLSIPIGALIATSYFSKHKYTLPVFISSILIWSLLLTTISTTIF